MTRQVETTYDEVKTLFDKWSINYTEDRAFLSGNKVLTFANINGANVEIHFKYDLHDDNGREWIPSFATIPSAGVTVDDVRSVSLFTGSMHNDVEFNDDRKHTMMYVQIKDVI